MPRLTSLPVANATPALPGEFIEAFQRLVPEGPIGVAVSGGSDSMALLAMARAQHPNEIHAATVNHGLRAEAQREAAEVAAFCASHAIPHTTLTAEGLATDQGNLQANARDARFDLLANWAQTRNLHAVLLGHTMDDQAETVLMRLARGSGAEGLAGMEERRDWQGIVFLRPLLGLRRVALRDWLRAAGIGWVDDPSNDDRSFNRVKARQALETLTPLGITVDGLAETAIRLRRQVEVLRADADRLHDNMFEPSPHGEARLDRELLRSALTDTGLRVLADTLMRIGAGSYRPRFRALEPLYHRLIGTKPVRTTLAGCLIEADATTIRVFPEHKANATT